MTQAMGSFGKFIIWIAAFHIVWRFSHLVRFAWKNLKMYGILHSHCTSRKPLAPLMFSNLQRAENTKYTLEI